MRKKHRCWPTAQIWRQLQRRALKANAEENESLRAAADGAVRSAHLGEVRRRPELLEQADVADGSAKQDAHLGFVGLIREAERSVLTAPTVSVARGA